MSGLTWLHRHAVHHLLHMLWYIAGGSSAIKMACIVLSAKSIHCAECSEHSNANQNHKTDRLTRGIHLASPGCCPPSAHHCRPRAQVLGCRGRHISLTIYP